MTTLEQPIMMDGIAGGLQITQKGIIKCEVVTTTGKIRSLEYEAYYIPGLKC